MLTAIAIGIFAIVLAISAFIAGVYLVKLWYMMPERRMTKAERVLNKTVEYFVYLDWYPEE